MVATTEFNTIVLSKATYVNPSAVATAAATYGFFTSGYEPPSQDRYIDQDVVKNQNGKFKYSYDNGPGFKKWAPFKVHIEENLYRGVGASAVFEQLKSLWEHPGVLGMRTPDGVYSVIWGDSLEKNFRIFPNKSTDKIEYVVVVQLEET